MAAGLRAALVSVLVIVACGDDAPTTSPADAAPPTRIDGGPDASPVADATLPDRADERDPLVPRDECGDVRVATRVFHGTLEPTYMPLTPGQVLAIGTFGGCSGTLIAPRWVLTASHCHLDAGDEFCIGRDPANPNVCFPIHRVVEHSRDDVELVELQRDVRERMPDLVPIAPLTERMDHSWLDRGAEAAGYGRDENGDSGTRKFTAEPIVELGPTTVVIDGMGERGVCFGDSGGPLMVLAGDGTVRVAGVLSQGDGSCVGRDTFTRADAHLTWIEQLTGPTIVEDFGCGAVDAVGRCVSTTAVWCEEGALAAKRCEDEGLGCGWSADAAGFRCIGSADVCEGFDAFGVCDGEVARWCTGNGPESRDCAVCGQVCRIVPEMGGVYCVPDPCMGVDFFGRCVDGAVEWCDEGQLERRDCRGEGGECRWIDDETGYFCDFCGDLGYLGRCQGEVAEWCDDGRLRRRDCGAEGRECRWIDDETGYFCD